MTKDLGYFIPKGMKKDLGIEYDLFKMHFENIGPNIKGEFKKLAGSEFQRKSRNLNIINTEMNQLKQKRRLRSYCKPRMRIGVIAILGDAIKDAETHSH